MRTSLVVLVVLLVSVVIGSAMLAGCGRQSSTSDEPVGKVKVVSVEKQAAPQGVVGKWTRDIGVLTCKITLESNGKGSAAWGADEPFMTFSWQPTTGGFIVRKFEKPGGEVFEATIKGELSSDGQRMMVSGVIPDGEFARF